MYLEEKLTFDSARFDSVNTFSVYQFLNAVIVIVDPRYSTGREVHTQSMEKIINNFLKSSDSTFGWLRTIDGC